MYTIEIHYQDGFTQIENNVSYLRIQDLNKNMSVLDIIIL